ncbi:MAG: P-type Cu+ transporter, partial [Acidimicrobiaceae bacterium]
MAETASTTPNLRTVDLEIGGMTCSSCAARIAKHLSKLDGVEADVNYATERATVTVDDKTTTDELIAEVASIGYSAALPSAPSDEPAGATRSDGDPEVEALRDRLIVSAVLGIPVLLMSMISALQFTYWQWLAFAMTAPVVVWGAWPFHRAAWL